jgi:hypothetical protein
MYLKRANKTPGFAGINHPSTQLSSIPVLCAPTPHNGFGMQGGPRQIDIRTLQKLKQPSVALAATRVQDTGILKKRA